MFELLGLFYKSSKKFEKRLKKLEAEMSVLKDVIDAATAQQDAIVAAVESVNKLVVEVKALLDDANIEGAQALLDNIAANSVALVQAAALNTELADRIPDPVPFVDQQA